MLMLLMVCLLSDAGQDAVLTPSVLTVVSSVPPNDAADGARFLMCPSWAWALLSNSCTEFTPAPSGTY
jgi:hypothetical protein